LSDLSEADLKRLIGLLHRVQRGLAANDDRNSPPR